MKRNVCVFLLVAFSFLLLSSLDADAAHQHKSYNYFWDSEGTYKGTIHAESGASDEDATLRSVVVYYHITDSDGETHSLLVSAAFWTRPDTDSNWSYSYGWFIDYDRIREFFDKHTSN